MTTYMEICPECHHCEESDGYGGNDCPECDTRMDVKKCSAFLSALLDKIAPEEAIVAREDAFALAKCLADQLPLYAAAPDLLEALELANSLLERYENGEKPYQTDDEGEQIFATISAAITKATGEEQ